MQKVDTKDASTLLENLRGNPTQSTYVDILSNNLLSPSLKSSIYNIIYADLLSLSTSNETITVKYQHYATINVQSN